MTEVRYQNARRYLKATDHKPEKFTDRQYEIAIMYFVNQLTMQDIARKIGVNQSTVSRTVETATSKLEKYSCDYIAE